MCNPLYTVYCTTANKDRLSVLQGLLDGRELEFLLNPLTFSLLETLQLPDKWKKYLELLPQEAAARLRQRISQPGNISPLASIIYDRFSVNSLGWSWQV